MFVTVDYRVGGFNYMHGREIQDEGSSNLGLLDQRLRLEWVADNITSFRGGCNTVTIWGESADSISVFPQVALLTTT